LQAKEAQDERAELAFFCLERVTVALQLVQDIGAMCVGELLALVLVLHGKSEAPLDSEEEADVAEIVFHALQGLLTTVVGFQCRRFARLCAKVKEAGDKKVGRVWVVRDQCSQFSKTFFGSCALESSTPPL
jgi:hypothetical protein